MLTRYSAVSTIGSPRSVLMLRHRFRQKIGITTDYPLENFIDEILGSNSHAESTSDANEDSI